MGIAHRMFLIDQRDGLYRLASTTFYAMLQIPTRHRFPQFAGQRVRTASTSVEFIDRQPTEVVRVTYDIVTFDNLGGLQADIFLAQQSSRAELAMLRMMTDRQTKTDVVDAVSRFIAHGGRWTPSRTLARAIEEAALGRTRCSRL